MAELSANPAGGSRDGLLGRFSDTLWRRPRLLILLLLTPPALWLGVIYLGSLFALLAQSFFSIDEFSGVIVYEFTLRTYREIVISRTYERNT